MGLLNFFKDRHSQPEEKANKSISKSEVEASIAPINLQELQVIEAKAKESGQLSVLKQASSFLNAAIPFAFAAADAVNQIEMAVVRFPSGVGWSDLCNSPHEGYKLLANFKDAKFNEMAAIKQAGLQGPAVANLALQGAAVVVGQAYMAQINEQLAGIESGISRLERSLEIGRQAKLKSAYDMTKRYALRFNDYMSSQDDCLIARNQIEASLKDSREIWHYQIAAMKDLQIEVEYRKKMKEEDILSAFSRLSEMERQAAAAFQLQAIVGQVCMQYRGDFSTKSIEREMDDLKGAIAEHKKVRHEIDKILVEKIEKLKGAPIALAEPDDVENRETGNIQDEVAHAIVVNLGRVRPDRMVDTAKKKNEAKKSKLISSVELSDLVASFGESYVAKLEELNFVFNEADTLVLEEGEIKFLKTGEGISD